MRIVNIAFNGFRKSTDYLRATGRYKTSRRFSRRLALRKSKNNSKLLARLTVVRAVAGRFSIWQSSYIAAFKPDLERADSTKSMARPIANTVASQPTSGKRPVNAQAARWTSSLNQEASPECPRRRSNQELSLATSRTFEYGENRPTEDNDRVIQQQGEQEIN